MEKPKITTQDLAFMALILRKEVEAYCKQHDCPKCGIFNGEINFCNAQQALMDEAEKLEGYQEVENMFKENPKEVEVIAQKLKCLKKY